MENTHKKAFSFHQEGLSGIIAVRNHRSGIVYGSGKVLYHLTLDASREKRTRTGSVDKQQANSWWELNRAKYDLLLSETQLITAQGSFVKRKLFLSVVIDFRRRLVNLVMVRKGEKRKKRWYSLGGLHIFGSFGRMPPVPLSSLTNILCVGQNILLWPYLQYLGLKIWYSVRLKVPISGICTSKYQDRG